MLIACPNCTTSYSVESSSLGRTGRSVRCARCRTVWFATDTSALPTIAQAHRTDMAVFATATPEQGSGEALPVQRPVEPPAALERAGITPPLDAGAWDTETVAEGSDLDQEPLPTPAPVVVEDAPALAPRHESEPAAELAPAVDIETVAARRVKRSRARPRFHWPFSTLSTAFLALVVVDSALIAWRTDLVRWAPQSASLYAAIGLPINLRGLAFNNVSVARETQDGVAVLVVQGTIESTVPRLIDVPRLRFAVRDQAGHEIYSWTALPAKNVLAPQETLEFRSRLAAPPPEGHEVVVRFFNRRDLGTGMQ